MTATSPEPPYPDPFYPVSSPRCYTYVDEGSKRVSMEGEPAQYLRFSWCMRRPPRVYRTCTAQFTRSGSIMSVGVHSYSSNYKITGGRYSTYDSKYDSWKPPSCLTVIRGDKLEWHTGYYTEGRTSNRICFSTQRCPAINTTIPTTTSVNHRENEDGCDWFCKFFACILFVSISHIATHSALHGTVIGASSYSI